MADRLLTSVLSLDGSSTVASTPQAVPRSMKGSTETSRRVRMGDFLFRFDRDVEHFPDFSQFLIFRQVGILRYYHPTSPYGGRTARQSHRESRSFAGGGVDGHGSSVGIHEVTHNIESKANA